MKTKAIISHPLPFESLRVDRDTENAEKEHLDRINRIDMRFAHTDVGIAKRIDKQACLTVFPSPHPFIARAIPAPPGLMSKLARLIAPSNDKDPAVSQDFACGLRRYLSFRAKY